MRIMFFILKQILIGSMTNQTAAWSENLARYVFMPKEKYNNDKEEIFSLLFLNKPGNSMYYFPCCSGFCSHWFL